MEGRDGYGTARRITIASVIEASVPATVPTSRHLAWFPSVCPLPAAEKTDGATRLAEPDAGPRSIQPAKDQAV